MALIAMDADYQLLCNKVMTEVLLECFWRETKTSAKLFLHNDMDACIMYVTNHLDVASGLES